MLAYAIIAVELAILYTVFWYVFLREPKPYRIQGSAWGVYDGPEPTVKNFATNFSQNLGAYSGDQAHSENCQCQVDQQAKIRRSNAIYEEWNVGTNSAPLTAGEVIRSQARGVERVSREMAMGPAKISGQFGTEQKQNLDPHQYLPNNPVEQYRSKHKTISAFLTELGDVLNRINVKLP